VRVLILVEHYAPYIGGAEELWSSLALALVQSGHTVRVLTTRHEPHLPLVEISQGVEIHRLPISNRFAFTFLSWRAALKHMDWADLVQTSSYNAALPARLAAFWRKKPVLITFHEVWGKLWLEVPGLTLLERILYFSFEKLILNLKFERFVAVSNFTAQALVKAGVSPERVIRIYNGLDYEYLNRISSTKKEDFRLCYFGRPGVSKGVHWILPAFQKAKAMDPRLKLKMILSKRPAKAYLKIRKQAEDLGLSEDIQWLHHLSKQALLEEVKSAGAVLIPSLSEGFCFSAAEAVALGVPILSSDRGALPEVVGGKVIGIEPLNSKGLAKAMVHALSGEWENREIKNFPLELTVKQYLALYNKLLA
jgi:glycosyltransferase involved in cell wall biosynthesis